MEEKHLFCSLIFLVIASFTCGVEIQCSYAEVNWSHTGMLYTCTGTVVSTNNPATITGITGRHTLGRINSDVKAFVTLDHKILTAIPEDFEKFFPNLEGFQWHNGNIKTIDASIFAPFPNLSGIFFENNKLTTLDGDLFQHTRKLREILFSRNLIEHVGHDLFTGLTNLTRAYFTSNPCVNSNYNGRQAIQELNLQLPILCPPLPTTRTTSQPKTTSNAPTPTTIATTTEKGECPSSCSIKTDQLEQRIMEMIEELQKQIREVNSNPWSG